MSRLKEKINEIVESGVFAELENLGNGILIINFNGKIEYVNEKFANHLDYDKADELIGSNFLEHMPSEQIKPSLDAWGQGKEDIILTDFKNKWYTKNKIEKDMFWPLCFNRNILSLACCVLKTEL